MSVAKDERLTDEENLAAQTAGPPPSKRELPTAPYLEAIVSYGFRGSMRFHVPGHKGGPGADPGLRTAIGERALALDICQDIEGIDVGPSPTPYERAEELAATAYGAGRTWFLTNGASQGNQALCLALAGPRDHVLVQRNSHASIVDGLVLSGGRASFVAPEYDAELGMAHGVTPEALEQALRRAPGISTAFIVSPTYYGMAADVGGCVEVAHAAGVALVVDCAWGSHFGFHPSLPESPTRLGRRRGADLDPQDRRQPHPVGHAARGRRRPDRPRRGGAVRAPAALHQPELAAAGLAGQRPTAAGRTWRGAVGPHPGRLSPGPARHRGDPGGHDRGRRAGRPAGDRGLGSAPDRDRHPRDRLHRL